VTNPAPDVVILAQWAAETVAQQRAAETLRSGFGPLAASKGEIEAIGSQYRVNRRDEPVELWSEQDASEARLKALPRPPRVLHLATHGFYRAADKPQDRPMLLAGVALADANRALREAGEDGILYAIEAQGRTWKAPSWWCCPPAKRHRVRSTMPRVSQAWSAPSAPPVFAMCWSPCDRSATSAPAAYAALLPPLARTGRQ